MNNTDILALLALIATIVLGIIAYIYTRIDSRSTRIPSLLITASSFQSKELRKLFEAKENYIYKSAPSICVHLRNLSSDFPIINIKSTIKISCNNEKNELIINDNKDIIENQDEEYLFVFPEQIHNMFSGILKFQKITSNHLIQYMERKGISDETIPPGLELTPQLARMRIPPEFIYCRVISEFSLVLRVDVSYLSGSIGGEATTASERFIVRPFLDRISTFSWTEIYNSEAEMVIPKFLYCPNELLYWDIQKS